MKRIHLFMLFAFCLQLTSWAQLTTDNVFVLPIRKLKQGQDIEDFKAKRDAYVATLEAQEGTLIDREFQPFFEFTNSGLALDSVFVGLTSFQDNQTFQEIGGLTGNTPEAIAFFNTFDFISFQILQPLDPDELVDLADFANLGTSQVWECAVRDLSQYSEFDQADYEEKRDAYLAVLAAQNNFVREIQWRSLSDTNIVVGMTIYKDAQSYSAVNNDQNFINAYLETGFLQNYPINVYGAIHKVLKGRLDPSCNSLGDAAFPEDITVFGGSLYTSNFTNGSIIKNDLSTGEFSTFVSPAEDEFSSAWGLRVDSARNRLLAILNQPYDFNPENAKAGKVNAYDLSNGNLLDSWDLPSACVGNSIDIDNEGNYYVGDIGPDTRIIRISPETDEVSIWADDSQWTDGSFGTGGMVYNKSNALYVAHAGSLWYVPINEDGSAGDALTVALNGTTAIDGSEAVNADGMVWAKNNTIFYAENDAFVPGHNGIVHKIELSSSVEGTNSNYIEGLDDCSGIYFANSDDTDYLYVNESQFGVIFGVNFVPTSFPFCAKAFEVNGIISSNEKKIEFQSSLLSVFPNPSNGIFNLKLSDGSSLKIKQVHIFDINGKEVRESKFDYEKQILNLSGISPGTYLMKSLISNGHTHANKIIVSE